MSCSSAANSSSSRSAAAEAVDRARWRRTGRARAFATWRAWASAQLQRRARLSTALAADRVRVVGPVGGIVTPDGVEHDAFAERPLADGELVEVEQLHRGGEHHRPRDDEVDAAGVEALDTGGDRRPSTRAAPCAARGTPRASIVSWLSVAGASSSRRAATISARFSSVPLLPTASLGSNVLDLARRPARAPRRCAPAARAGRASRSDPSGRSSAVRRATPSGTLVAHIRLLGVADHHLEAAATEVEAHRGRGIEHDRRRGPRRRSGAPPPGRR